jgi:hypothetical protein
MCIVKQYLKFKAVMASGPTFRYSEPVLHIMGVTVFLIIRASKRAYIGIISPEEISAPLFVALF